jgi:hypothetical protein
MKHACILTSPTSSTSPTPLIFWKVCIESQTSCELHSTVYAPYFHGVDKTWALQAATYLSGLLFKQADVNLIATVPKDVV